LTKLALAIDDPRDIAIVANAVWATDRASEAKEHLSSLIERFPPGQAAELSGEDMGMMRSLLSLSAQGRTRRIDWGIVAAGVRFFSVATDSRAVSPLRKLARGMWGRRPVPRDLSQAAEHALASLRARLERQAAEGHLLRASTPADDNATLLRPASGGEEPPEQLLRKADE
jgi:hypothetical protein